MYPEFSKHVDPAQPDPPALIDQDGLPVPHPGAPVMPYVSDRPMPGALRAVTGDGRVVWISAAPTPTPHPPVPETQPLPAWAKGTALVLVATGGSAVLGAIALSIVASAAEEITAVLSMVAKVALLLLVLLGALIVTWRRRRPTRVITPAGEPVEGTTVTNITNNVTVHARGFAARGSATGIGRLG